MLHFFIDTNVLLSFYEFTPDDLTRLERLADQVVAGQYVILATSHVRDEFVRNRDSRIASARKEFSSQRLDFKFPRLVDQYDETERLRKLARDYSELHGQLMARIDEDARDGVLKADELIGRFFSGATTLEVTPEIVERARVRGELSKPPGKRGSIGDAVNWELLLDFRPPDKLWFVTGDGDFYSPLDDGRPLPFLTDEWEREVGTPIGFVRRLSQLPEEVPHDVLPVEDAPDSELDELVGRLGMSSNFEETHRLIAVLRQVPHFTPRHLRDLVAALENSQVGWIIDDVDVLDFYSRLLGTYADVFSDEDRAALESILRAEPDRPF